MNLNPIIIILDRLISIYNYVLLIWVIYGWLIAFKILNPFQPLVYKAGLVLDRLTEPVLRRIRKYVPIVAGVDLSALVLFILLHLLRSIIFSLYN